MLAWYWIWIDNTWECGYMGFDDSGDAFIRVGNTIHLIANVNRRHLQYIIKPNSPNESSGVKIGSFNW